MPYNIGLCKIKIEEIKTLNGIPGVRITMRTHSAIHEVGYFADFFKDQNPNMCRALENLHQAMISEAVK